VAPLFLSDLDQARKKLFEGAMSGSTPDIPIQDIFALYRRTKMMIEMFIAFTQQ
jgi:hypothetical protein